MPHILRLTKNILVIVGLVIVALVLLSYLAFYIFEYEAEAAFPIYNTPIPGPRHVSTSPRPNQPQPTLSPGPTWQQFQATLQPWPTIPPARYTSLSTSTGQVKGSTTKPKVACLNPLPANRIVNAEVPAIVERVFLEVFNYQINHELSVYWKGRARCDKVTVESLRGAMAYHNTKGLFAPGWKIQ